MIIYEVITILLVLAGIVIVITSYVIDSRSIKEKKTKNRSKREEDYEEYGARIEELNKKILELNEYHEFMKAEMESKHKELLFLYQIINEKSNDIKQIDINNNKIENGPTQLTAETIKEIKRETVETESDNCNSNKRIMDLSEKGYTVQEIARMLDIGQGEVKLVLNLFK